MRYQSKSRARSERTDRPHRVAFVREYGFCWACFSSDRIDCHEMAKGCHRGQAIKKENRCAWFVACYQHNMFELNDYSVWPIARQLALKKIHDPAHYDRVAFNILRGREPDAISAAEVRSWERKERKR